MQLDEDASDLPSDSQVMKINKSLKVCLVAYGICFPSVLPVFTSQFKRRDNELLMIHRARETAVECFPGFTVMI